MTVLETITMLNSKIYNFFKESGIGSTHVMTKTGNYMLKRWGVWTPWFTILVTKILPVEQIPHNHEGNFFSILLWGTYSETVYKYNIEYKRFSNWFNYVTTDEHHKVHCNKNCYTLLFMGKRKQNVTLKVGDKYYDYKKGIKEYR